MGVFDFIKSVGEKIGITSEDESPKAEDLKAEVAKHGLDAENLEVTVDGDTVKVAGATESSSIREKIILALGNTLGISKVEEEIAVKNAEPDATFYTVKKGDTLWAISSKHYGNGAKYQGIFEANKPMLSHPDKIYPGQVLRIPPLD
ncbi:peptidoglycan-binding protein LysM [Cohaesibacter celericrescens]|uniref:Potassium binding protein Kbp n=1 Tax=Cohaesibacter celericrescens TaxID=2067669 RepID=A0A2N5XUG7_9HYPH|nr:peptidoglycan-binding protein LysM [Cohaesibacter celericrescens]PLW78153.1 peptidoglycan-binding protein LysM [Cohaesibacter celericrescens]